MKVKDFLRLFIPPVYYKIKYDYILKKQEILSPLPQVKHNSERMIILGNGPSLNESVQLYKDEIMQCDRIAVNYFASSNLYENIKPNMYVFADPAFFEIPESHKQSIKSLVNDIRQKTTWLLRVIVPFSARGSSIIRELAGDNPNIIINYYYNEWNDVSKKGKFEAWDKNILAPPSQNVLNVALYLSLFWGYKETYLIGADSSFLEDLKVNQETNELITVDSHFYNNKDIYKNGLFCNNLKYKIIHNWNLHDLIYAYGRMFEGYYELRRYADYKGLKIYNASEYSWINVFERRKLK